MLGSKVEQSLIVELFRPVSCASIVAAASPNGSTTEALPQGLPDAAAADA